VCREVSDWCVKLHCCTPGLVRTSVGSTPYKGTTSPIPIELFIIIIIIIIIIINCNWVVTRWQWLFYMYTKYELVTTKFKSGGLHEKHVVTTWNLGNHLSVCL